MMKMTTVDQPLDVVTSSNVCPINYQYMHTQIAYFIIVVFSALWSNMFIGLSSKIGLHSNLLNHKAWCNSLALPSHLLHLPLHIVREKESRHRNYWQFSTKIKSNSAMTYSLCVQIGQDDRQHQVDRVFVIVAKNIRTKMLILAGVDAGWANIPSQSEPYFLRALLLALHHDLFICQNDNCCAHCCDAYFI